MRPGLGGSIKLLTRANQLPREEIVEQMKLASLAAGAWVIPDQVIAPQWGTDAPATAMVRLAGAKESWLESALLIYRSFYPTKQYAQAHDKILDTPEPIVKLHALGESSVDFVVRPRVKTEDYWDVYWDVTREVKMRFDREGVSIPFPQRDLHLYREEAATA